MLFDEPCLNEKNPRSGSSWPTYQPLSMNPLFEFAVISVHHIWRNVFCSGLHPLQSGPPRAFGCQPSAALCVGACAATGASRVRKRTMCLRALRAFPRNARALGARASAMTPASLGSWWPVELD
jgi:hypothetical protein